MKKSINSLQAVGTVSELNFKVETKDCVLRNGTTEKTVKCQSIGKNDFKNPNLTIMVNDNIIGFDFYQTHEKKLDENGKVVDNPRFKAIETIMNYEKGTRVKVDGSYTNNEYVNKEMNFVSFVGLNAFNVTSSGVPDEDYCDSEISGIIKAIKPEMKTVGDDQQETGRYIVEFFYLDRNEDAFPINLIVDEDLADDLQSEYEVGDSVKFEVEVTSRQVGGTTKKSGGIGHRDSKKVSGFLVTEYKIFGADAKFEEENEYYIEKSDFKKKLDERKVKIDAKIQEAKDKPTTTTKSGLGSRPSKAQKEDGEANPFDDDDNPFA